MKRRSLIIFLILLLLTFGCKKSARTSSYPNEIRLNFAYPPLSIDPRKSTEPITCVMNFMLYEGLMHLEPDGKVNLALAKNVHISKDKKSYLFELRPSSWSDGTPVTAYDFEKAWKLGLKPDFNSKSSHLFFSLKNGLKANRGECSIDEVGVQSLDEKTLLVQLEQPNPYFLQLTAYPTYFPVPNQGKEIPYPQNGKETVTNGPFVLLSWKNDNEIIVEKNPYYWQEMGVKIERIYISMISDEATALTLFEKGKLDWVGGLISPLPLDAIASLKNTNQILKHPIAGTTFCTFNTKCLPFHNLNIRKAFAYAIDRRSLIDNISQMPDDIATGIIPPVLKQYNNLIPLQDNQLELSRNHFEFGLQELGMTRKNFPTVTYSYFSSELHRKLAVALQNQWHRVLGIQVELECSELKTHLNKLYSHQFEFAQMSWIAQYFDQTNYLERLKKEGSSRNYTGWESPLFENLLEESYNLDSEERFGVLERAEKIVMEEVPMTPFYHYHLIYLKNPKLKNIEISPLGDIQFRKAYLD